VNCIRKTILGLVAGLFLCATPALGTIFGSVRGVIHDPQHRPVPRVGVTLRAANSEWTSAAVTDDAGEFNFDAVPLGEYQITVTKAGFAAASQNVVVNSNAKPVVHFQLALATVTESVNVSDTQDLIQTDSATPTTLIDREDVARTPGAGRTNSVAAITNFVPGAYVTHDQLHVRGGHQVSWLVDGVPVPNTNIASNVGPQFDPKDVDYIEAQRGGYDAEYGDRTYGVFNVVPRTGFERNRQAELITSLGSFYQTNDQINFGSHSERFAYYASVNGNYSGLGLETPVAEIIHDAQNGYGGFGSLIFNPTPANQLRLVTSLRRDEYEIPNTPEQQAAGISDVQREADAFVNFSWVRTFKPGMLLTVSPFYHYNSANYESNPHDFPTATTDDRASNYAGGQATFSATVWHNDWQAGVYGFAQHDNALFSVIYNDHSNPNFQDTESISGNITAVFLDDKIKVTPWLTLTGGVRQTHFAGSFTENETTPRAGVALRLPRLNWVFRASYGQYYQAPPLLTASGPLLEFVNSQNLGFIPLHGEHDEEREFGVTIPWRGWQLDINNFHTLARNCFDHNSVGNSNIFFPLTIDGALIRGWETTLRSPQLWKRAQVHLAYSNQVAYGFGGITGGLTDFSPPAGYFLLDHDQRNTLNVGGEISLPWHSYASTDVYYGSGFADGDNPPHHLPQHTTFDLMLGKTFGERISASITGLNVANRYLLIDNSQTFGGTHWNNPREVFVEVRYRFHY
jgi:outer membrane cobalamin receptor